MRLKRSSRVEKSINILLRLLLKGGDRQGFTLIELLVSMLIGSLIVSGLLYGVVEIMQTNQRDASRSDTQRDIQMAMDYIVRDLREATYVYGVMPISTTSTPPRLTPQSCLVDYGAAAVTRGTQGLCTGLLQYLPPDLRVAGNTPVLAFWKPEPLPSKIRGECSARSGEVGTEVALPDGTLPALSRTPCVAQRMYTLVVYSLNTQPASTFQWKGKARIMRYQLPHFTENVSVGAVTPGWVAPIAKDKRPLTWPIGDTATQSNQNLQLASGTPAPGNNIPLTDFVDDAALSTYAPSYCPQGFDSPSGFDENGAPSTTFNPAFYVCVRSGSVTAAAGSTQEAALAAEKAAAAGQGINPEVHVVLRGNAAGRGGIPKNTGEVPFQMETRVLSRGVYGKLAN